MKLILLFITFVLSFGYELVVNNSQDAQKLENIGFSCNKQAGFYVCLISKDLNELKRIQDFLNTKFNIQTKISEDINQSGSKVSGYKKIKNNKISNSVYNKTLNLQTNIKVNSKENIHLKRHGYCIQISSFKNLKNAEKVYYKYKSYPLSRIEKIGNFYVLRLGEGSFKTIKNMAFHLKGIIRKCDIVPQRIVKSNFNIIDNNVSDKNISKNSSNNINLNLPIDNSSKLKAMYYYLNSGNLIKAKENALDLINIYPNDAYLVLAIINMKNQNFKKACQILSKLNTKKALKLKTDACYTYYLKEGFNILSKSPEKSLRFFKKAIALKPTLSAKIGEAYAYLNLNKPNEAYNIFKKLYKNYPDNEKVIEGYANTLYILKKYNELEKIKDKLSPELKEKLSSVDFYVKLKKAQDLIKKGKYKVAENILLNLYIQKPDEINVLLSLADLYLQTNQIDKAQNFYNNVLVLSPNNIYALEGLEAVCMKKQDFNNALKYSDKIISLGFKDINRKLIQKFYYLKTANFYLNRNNIDKAYEYAQKLQQIDKNDPLVFTLLGDIYFKQNNYKFAYKYYAKAYSFNSDNFSITLKFLYTLLNLNLYDQIKIILSKIDINKLTSEQKKKLKDFYITLYAKYSSYLLNNGDYYKAIKVVNKGLMMDPNNFELLSNKAWICMKLKNYTCANQYFSKALLFKDDDMLKYGLALSYINLGNKQKARSILDSIHTKNKNLIIKIAGAYLQIGDIEKSNRLLKNLKPQIKAEQIPINNNYQNQEKQNDKDFFPNPFLNNSNNNFNEKKQKFARNYINNNINNNANINFVKQYPVKKKIILKKNVSLFKEYLNIKKQIQNIEQKYISNLNMGIKVRSKSGLKGLGELTRISLPYIKGNFFIHHKKIYFILDSIVLDSGNLNNYSKVGTPSKKFPITKAITSAYGISPKIGFENAGEKYFLFQIGATPLESNLVPSTLTAKIKIGLNEDNKKFFISLYRKSIKDSITSYLGNKDPFTGKKWGRVMANGMKIEAEKSFDKKGSMLYMNLTGENLKGENTPSNYDIDSEMLLLFFTGNEVLDEDYLGFYSNMMHFKENQNNYYFGDGGYFSPNIFLSFMPRYEGYFYSKDKKFISKLMLMMGGSYIDNWDDKNLNFAFDLGASAQYLLFDNLALEGGIDYRNSQNYNDFFFTLMFKYYFGKKLYLNKTDIDNFTKKVIQW